MTIDMPYLAFWTPGPVELIIILVVAVLIFGRRLPEIARGLGKSLTEFKKGLSEAKDTKDELEKDVNMTYVMIAFQSSGYRDMKENAALDVASSILGEGRSSRLYRRLVEQDQLVTSVNAFIYPMSHSGTFIIYATMDRDAVQDFKKAVIEEVEKLRDESVDSEELNKVKTMLKADYQFANETGQNIAHTIGYYNTLGMLDYITQYERMIDDVTSEDVSQYVLKVLNPLSYSIGIINQRMPETREAAGE